MSAPEVQAFFDAETYTVSYVIADPTTGDAAVLDSVLNYDASSGRTSTRSADALIEFVRTRGLAVRWLLETHVHADHLSAAQYLKAELGGTLAIGTDVTAVQEAFGPVFNLQDLAIDGRQFDHLFADGESFAIGDIQAKVMATPGHTPACISYVIGNCVFVGDTLFMPDYGSARTDFPGGDARTLYQSVQRLLSLPDDTRMFLCHDYKAAGRDQFAWETTVAKQREENIHMHTGISEDEFVAMREQRDATLNMPALILPSIQVNICAGHLPEPEENGTRYLKIPLDTL